MTNTHILNLYNSKPTVAKNYIYVAKVNLGETVDEDEQYFFNTERDLSTNEVWVSTQPIALPKDEWINRGINEDVAEFYEIEI